MLSAVTAIPAAPSSEAEAHFGPKFTFETDCWDVHDALSKVADFVVLDVRNPALFAEGNVPEAINLPHGKIASKMAQWPADTLFHHVLRWSALQGAARGALRLAKLGRP